MATTSTVSSANRMLPILVLAGHWWSAALLIAWGTIVVGLIDNVVYPILVGNRLMMHTVPAFLALVGGLLVFGTPGIILGPLVVAVSLVLIQIWRRRALDAGQATPVRSTD